MAERSFDGWPWPTCWVRSSTFRFVRLLRQIGHSVTGLNQQIFDSNISWNFCSYVLVSELPYLSDPMIDPILLANLWILFLACRYTRSTLGLDVRALMSLGRNGTKRLSYPTAPSDLRTTLWTTDEREVFGWS